MTDRLDVLLVLLVLTSLLLLGGSRIRHAVQVVALQGVLLGLLTLAVRRHDAGVHSALLVAGSICLKGILFPVLLARAGRDVDLRREVAPFVRYVPSLFVGVLAMGASLWMASRLTLPSPAVSPHVVPVAFFMSFSGLVLIVGRRAALLQVVGYLALENGIYAFGVAMVQGVPALVEVGMLLDLFVAVFVMGITIFHINREFDHIDTDRLASLRE